MYIPFAIGFLDATPWRKKTLIAFQAEGIAVGLCLLYSLMARPITSFELGQNRFERLIVVPCPELQN